MLNLRPQTPVLKNVRNKIKILSADNLFCRKFAAICHIPVRNL